MDYERFYMEKFYRIKMVADKSKLSEEGITEEELFRKIENACKNFANIIKEKKISISQMIIIH